MWMNIFRLLSREPDLVFEHVAGYAALAKAEFVSAKRRVVVRLVAFAVALLFAFSFVIVASIVATLAIAGILPATTAVFSVPVALLAVTVVAGVVFRSQARSTPSELAREIEADLKSVRAFAGGE